MSSADPPSDPNPYSSPTSDWQEPDAAEAHAETVEILRKTRPWVIFISVIIFLGAGFMIIGGLMVVAYSALSSTQGFGISIFLFSVYLIMGLLYLAPAVYLMRYGRNIKRFMESPTSGNLNAALEAQKSFWRFAGVTTAAILSIYLVMTLGALIFAALSR